MYEHDNIHSKEKERVERAGGYIDTLISHIPMPILHLGQYAAPLQGIANASQMVTEQSMLD